MQQAKKMYIDIDGSLKTFEKIYLGYAEIKHRCRGILSEVGGEENDEKKPQKRYYRCYSYSILQNIY